MKKILLLALYVGFSNFLFAQISIYDIQYTTEPGDGTYPSTRNGQTVTTGGIVTATDYSSGQYFISSSQGGTWNGIFIYDNNYSPAIGDSVLITGLVDEYQGYTEIKNISSFEVISTSNTLPATLNISTVNIANEAYEGVFVEISDCNVSSTYDAWGGFGVNDGSGSCEIATKIFKLNDYGFPLVQNYTFNQVIGVIGFNNWIKQLCPRSIDDFISDKELVISTDEKSVDNNASFELPVKVSILNQTEAINSYSLKIQYDQTVFTFTGFNKTGTISESGTITDASTAGNIILNYSGSTTCDNVNTLLKLNFTPIQYGEANLQITGTTINGSAFPYSSIGILEFASSECEMPIGDTLTIVQRPLLNIPSIVTPNEEFNIVCFAPQSTSSWGAELLYEDIVVPLNITQSNYNTDLAKWTLTTVIPNVEIYELYDVIVTASDGIVDSVTNAVKIIDQYKDDYYFVHITDTHLPGHSFYGAAGYETDYSELEDFHEVIKDINLIHPEFVLLTGDLINEGELEDFECLRNHTLTVELLEKFEVPVYIVPGNHDLGGWDATPPSQGTARREWWRFFGWRQREIPPTKNEYLTHDYSFDYGNTHYVGLEAYDNYDSYMYDVYGNESFIPSQITWLNADLAAAGDMNKVLFYHYDFKNELDLQNLGVDMALWGHNHSNTGDINSHPYSLSTAAVCDERRAYRVVRVNGNNLQAENTIQTHTSGDMLTINFNEVNDGSLDLVSATINNAHNLSFSNGLVKFIMPISEHGYNVTNGILLQVMDNGSTVTCYVEVTIPANGQITATIEKKTSNNLTSIYDIQYTTVSGDGSYPSTLNGQIVNAGGIVTATNYLGGRYFMSSSQGEAWNGILIYDDNYSPSIGDSILITGTVAEYEGYTEIINLTSLQVVSSDNTLPQTVKISSNAVTNEEYEGVLVEVNSCDVSNVFDEYGNWSVNDGNESCDIRHGIYNLMADGFTLIEDYSFNSIIGVVAYYYGSTSIQPRGLHDINSADNGFILKTEDKSAADNTVVELPVLISIIKPYQEISNYTLKIQFNSEVFHYDGYDKINTISEQGSITDNSTEGNVELNYTGSTLCEKTDTLVKLKFTPIATGIGNIQLSGTNFNSNDLAYSIIGNLESTYTSTTQVDLIKHESLLKYFPNPFSEEMNMEYEIQIKSNVNISIYNLTGQLIKVLVNETKNPGKFNVKWKATNSSENKVKNGNYIYKYNINGKQISSGQILYMK